MMDQHAAPIVAINNENIVPTVKNNTISFSKISFAKIKDLVICKAIIPSSSSSLDGSILRCKSFDASGAYLFETEVHIFFKPDVHIF